jgi:outer membrane protein TolC
MYIEKDALSPAAKGGEMVSHKKGWLFFVLVPAVMMLAAGMATARGLYDKPPELERLIEELLENNEELQSMVEERDALAAEISVAGALDDPRLGIGVANLPTDTFSFNQEPMTQKQLFIAQKFPWFGKLDLRTQKAAITVERQTALIEAKRLELVKSLATIFYDLGFVDASLQVNAELTQMVSRMLEVAEAGYASGKSPQQDVFQGQVELGKLIDERVSLQKRKRTMAARINELLNRPEFLEVDVPADPGSLEIQLDPAITRHLALANNPMLRVRQADIDRASINIDLARKNYYPDMDVRVGYGQRDEDVAGRDLPDFMSASVVINLPLWQKQKQDKQLLAEQNRLKSATKSYENLQHALPHQVDALLNEISALQESYKLFSMGLIEQTANWSLSALSAYEVGKVDFDTMINAHLRALRFELQAERYQFQLNQKLTELETLAGIAMKNMPDEPGSSDKTQPIKAHTRARNDRQKDLQQQAGVN